MTEAVIVSTARTGLTKSWKGAFNMTHGATLGGHVIKAAVERAKVDPAEVEDVIMGCAYPEGATGGNIARQAALRAGFPVTVGGVTVNRFCSSGLQTIAMAAHRVIVDKVPVMVAGGVESISCVQNDINRNFFKEAWLEEHKPDVYLPMLQTAENVAKRYKIPREKQDEYGVQSQQRAAAAHAAGKFNDEIVPIKVTAGMVDKATGALGTREVTVAADEGIRADTTYEGVSKIRTAIPGGCIAAGNASQFSDGASAVTASSPSSAACSRWASSAASPSPAASRTRWGSARCSRCRACSSARGSRCRTSTCGSSTRPSRCRCSTAATSSASRTTGSTSTAAPSRWATRTASRARAWSAMR
jgi:acetyl-CoA C-acetyltransferase